MKLLLVVGGMPYRTCCSDLVPLNAMTHIAEKGRYDGTNQPVFAGLFAFISLRESFSAADRFNLFFAFLGATGLGCSAISHPEEGGKPEHQSFAMLLCTIAAVFGMYSNKSTSQLTA